MITHTAERTLTAIRSGNDAAFATLLEQHRLELRVYYSDVLGSVDTAENVVQETFLEAWRSRRTFSGDTPFRTWLHRIATEITVAGTMD